MLNHGAIAQRGADLTNHSEGDYMKKFRKFGAAMALSMFIGAGMVTFSTPVHAAVPGSDHSISVRCALLQRAIDAASATFGADSALVAYLQAQYSQNCGQ